MVHLKKMSHKLQNLSEVKIFNLCDRATGIMLWEEHAL